MGTCLPFAESTVDAPRLSSAVPEDIASVSSEFSVPSRTPSIVSWNSLASTVSPWDTRRVQTLDAIFGPMWRERVR